MTGSSRTWILCVRRPRNDSDISGWGIVRTVGSGSSAICTDMWLHIIWIWASCSSARCPGAPCERARHRTVWTTSGGHTMCCRISSRLVCRNLSRHGLSGDRFGWMPSNPAIRGSPLMSCCSATLISRCASLPRLKVRAATYCISEGLPHLSAGVCVTSNGLGAV